MRKQSYLEVMEVPMGDGLTQVHCISGEKRRFAPHAAFRTPAPCYPATLYFPQLSRKPVARLNTSLPGAWSLMSATK